MNQADAISSISGAQAVLGWFGYWPSFHDAEVVSLELSRSGDSRLKVHAFRMTSELNVTGHFVCDKHAIVSFVLHGVVDLELSGFNKQNVLSGLLLRKADAGYEVILGACYGVSGSIIASRVSIELEPGMPEASIYAVQRDA